MPCLGHGGVGVAETGNAKEGRERTWNDNHVIRAGCLSRAGRVIGPVAEWMMRLGLSLVAAAFPVILRSSTVHNIDPYIPSSRHSPICVSPHSLSPRIVGYCSTLSNPISLQPRPTRRPRSHSFT